MQGAAKTTEKSYKATEARSRFSDIFDEAYFGQRVFVQKHNRKVAIVSMEFIEHVDRLLEIEAELEAKAAELALKEFQHQGGKSLNQIKQELGME